MNAPRHLGLVALVLLLAAFLGVYAMQVWDVDLWWHLATGRSIVAAAAIPDRDPFGVYDAAGARSVTILKGYWVMQVLLFEVMQKLGVSGLIALRATFLVGCLLVLARRAAAAHPAARFAVVVLAGLTLVGFTGERPQLMSFLLVGVLFWLLDRHEDEGRERWLYPIPAVMLLWANCHGGVVLGAVLLVARAAARAATRWKAWSRGGGRERNVFLAVVALSLLASIASPAGWSPYATVIQLEGTEFQSRVAEYLSPLALWREQGTLVLYPYAALLALALPALVALVRERRLERAALVLLLGGLSLTAFRYLPFFVLGAGPYVAVGLSRLSPRLLPASSLVEAVVAAGSAAALVLGVRGEWMFQRGVREGSVPLDAVAYLERAHASGKVLSAFEWGGYVIWGTEARVRPFVDARNLDERKFAEYTHMIWATQDGLRYFAREGFDYVLLPPGNRFTGEAYPLNVLLMRDAGWRLAYSDGAGFLFASRAAAAPDR